MNSKETGGLDAFLAIALLTLVASIAAVAVCGVIGFALAAVKWGLS